MSLSSWMLLGFTAWTRAGWYLASRMGQGTAMHVHVRFAFFLPQLFLLGWMVLRLALPA
jgi:hypothetical protein